MFCQQGRQGEASNARVRLLYPLTHAFLKPPFRSYLLSSIFCKSPLSVESR